MPTHQVATTSLSAVLVRKPLLDTRPAGASTLVIAVERLRARGWANHLLQLLGTGLIARNTLHGVVAHRVFEV